jgi:hypothetical protein
MHQNILKLIQALKRPVGNRFIDNWPQVLFEVFNTQVFSYTYSLWHRLVIFSMPIIMSN